MPPPAESPPLDGCGVVVTRPAGHNDTLIALLEAEGARVFECPLLQIEACPVASAALARARPPDWLIFTSRNAVEFAFVKWPWLAIPGAAGGFSAVGAGTAAALRARGVSRVLIPPGNYSSEGLLELAEFQDPANLRIQVVTGEGGRTLLADTLRARGARVDCLEVYRRLAAGTGIQELFRKHARDIHLVIITSVESLRIYLQGGDAAGARRLTEYPLVAASARIADAAAQSAVTAPIETAARVSDEDLAHACWSLWRQLRQ